MRPRAHIGPLLLAVGLWAAAVAPAVAQNPVVRENQKPGTTDWLVTRVEAAAANERNDRYRRQRAIEGYVSRTSVRAGDTLTAFVSTSPAASYRADVYRLGYYGGKGGRLIAKLGPFPGTATARARGRPAAADRSPLGEVVRHPDRRRLAERRLRRQAHHHRPRSRELPDLGRARRAQGRSDVPGVRPHLAGLQPLAGVALALRLEGRAVADHARFARRLRSALRLLLQPAAGGLRAALGRLRRVPAVGVPARLLARGQRLRRHLRVEPRHARRPRRPAAGEGLPLGRARRVLDPADVRQRGAGARSRREPGVPVGQRRRRRDHAVGVERRARRSHLRTLHRARRRRRHAGRGDADGLDVVRRRARRLDRDAAGALAVRRHRHEGR